MRRSSNPLPMRARAGAWAALVCAGLLATGGCDSSTDASPTTTPAGAGTVDAAGRAEAALPQPAPAVPPANACLAAECHEDLTRLPVRHALAEAGACDSCHEPEQPGHKFPLKRAGAALCTGCHPVTDNAMHTHAVIDEQGCLPCHRPHGSAAAYMLSSPSVELTCQPCHAIERRAVLHAPFGAGQCTACHDAHAANNAELLLGGAGTEHCLVCHESTGRQLRDATAVHQPLAEQPCTVCHAAHSSEHADLLNDRLDTLCFGCHAGTAEEMRSAAEPHDAVLTGRRCANCHDGHAARQPDLLREDLRSVCLRCHGQPLAGRDGHTIPDMRPELLERKYLHGPVQSGQCEACHAVHGAPYPRLLTKPFPSTFYADFEQRDYALCFECHEVAAILEPETDTATGFRDGSRSLHYVHVHRDEKGRTCRTCHEMHGSNLPFHMASEVPFEGGGWSMPIGFELRPEGGGCQPGCHEPMEYRRGPAAREPIDLQSQGKSES